jgi:hypothetical protein
MRKREKEREKKRKREREKRTERKRKKERKRERERERKREREKERENSTRVSGRIEDQTTAPDELNFVNSILVGAQPIFVNTPHLKNNKNV